MTPVDGFIVGCIVGGCVVLLIVFLVLGSDE